MLAIGFMIACEWFHCIQRPEVMRPDVAESWLLPTHVSVLYIPLTAVIGFLLVWYHVLYTQYIYFVILIFLMVTTTRILEHLRSAWGVKR